MFEIGDKLKVVSDLEFMEINPLFRKKEKTYLIGSRKRDRVLSTHSEEVMQQIKIICGYLNGENSLDDIYKQVGYDYKTINIVINKLSKAELLESYTGTINSELELVAKNLISIKIKETSEIIRKICGKIVRLYPFVISFLLLVVMVMFWTKRIIPLSVVYSGREIIVASIIMYLFTVLHELGHLLVAWCENIEIKSVNVSLRWYVIPIIYVKYRGINFLQPKVKAKLLMGGLAMNLFFAVVLFIAWNIVENKIILLLSMYNFIMFLSSLYPQTLSDGYYLLLLLTNQPSIRVEAVKWIFSSNKSHPSKMTIVFICMYIFCTVSGLFSTYFIFRETLNDFCMRFNIDTKFIMNCYFIIYLFLIIKMIKSAKKKLVE